MISTMPFCSLVVSTDTFPFISDILFPSFSAISTCSIVSWLSMLSISLLSTLEISSESFVVLSTSVLSSVNSIFSSETLFNLVPPNSSEITLEESFFRCE